MTIGRTRPPAPEAVRRGAPRAGPGRPRGFRRRPERVGETVRLAAAFVAAGLAAACAAPGASSGSAGGVGSGALPPPGYGTLRQDDVTISLVAGPLQIKLTPLAESVTRVTAPDTYQRLSAIAEAHDPAADPERRGEDLFLVQLFSDQTGVAFSPDEITLRSRGFRVRPARISPVTPGWGERRLRQRETEMAVYAFPGADVESDLVLEYQGEESGSWSSILRRVQVERARARARAGVDG